MVVRYSDAMTRNVSVSEEIFDRLKSHFTDKEIVEITGSYICPIIDEHVLCFTCEFCANVPLATVAAYNCGMLFLIDFVFVRRYTVYSALYSNCGF